MASFFLWGLSSLAFGALGAGLYQEYGSQLIPKARVGSPRAAGEPRDRAAETSAAASSARSDEVLAGDVRALRTQLDSLAKETDLLKDRVDTLPKADSSPNLTTLQIKVADLAKAADEAAPLTGQVERIGSRLAQMSQALDTLRQDLSAFHTTAAHITAVPPASPSPPLAPERARRQAGKPVLGGLHDTNHETLARGAELFKQGKYQEAFDTFSLLELSDPDDARIWYFAALSRGFATKRWGNGTEQLVERGIERERAGTPQPSEIDAAFHDLTSATGKDWLDAYRQRVRLR